MAIIENVSVEYVIQTFGQFDVRKRGSSLLAASSGTKKIWELYKFMLTHRGHSFTPEALMDQLWIGQVYTQPRSTLRKQMHRLRKILSEESCPDSIKTLTFSNGYYRWNDNLQLQLDSDFFENFSKQGDELKNTSPEQALEIYTKALALYRGDYLPECTEQYWVFSFRNYYRNLYLKTVLNAEELLKIKEDYDHVIDMYHNAIQIDIYEEVFHIRLLEALILKGEYRQALEHYEFITEFYDREMGIKPSLEMKNIYKRLRAANNTDYSEANVQDTLDSESLLENAFYCEPDVFKGIYELERRRNERTQQCFEVGIITVSEIRGQTLSQSKLRMSHIKNQLYEKLRKGDTFTSWNQGQFIVLLPGMDSESTENVLKRALAMDEGARGIDIKIMAHLSLDYIGII